jgi:hypothetical protein
MNSLRDLILTVVLLAWTIVGPLLWIPLVVRTAVLFTAMVFLAAMSSLDLGPARARLDRAVGLLPRGYRLIVDSMGDEEAGANQDQAAKPAGEQLGALFKEAVWSLAFWVLLGLILF